MRRLMHALVGLTVAVSSATPAQAELQWQSTGVRPAAHNEPAPRVERQRPTAKAPSIVRKSTAKPAPPVVQQATRAGSNSGVQQAVATAPAVARRQGQPRIDTAVQPACNHCGCHDACECGTPYYEEHGPVVMEPGCGITGCGCGGDPSCGFDPSCGLTYGEPCGCGDIGCGGACSDGVGCGDVCGVPIMLHLPPLRELTFTGGVQAFKNPLDPGDRGNFGVNYGVNAGGVMTWFGIPGLGYQIGYRGVSSQLHGNEGTGTSDAHTQSFITAGLFRRNPVGLQYGVVYDVLRDERRVAQDFSQIRGLISVTNPRGHEIGFHFATNTNDAQIDGITFQAIEQYLLFYRMHGCQGGEFRAFGGLDDDSKGIVGADFSVPLTDRWSLETGFTYVIPEEDNAGQGSTEEAWNLGMNIVWHYGRRAKQSYQSQFRPLFRVADNGSLITDSRN
ncbi:MAG: DUF6666 family protein [Planctomycetota bacterium]